MALPERCLPGLFHTEVAAFRVAAGSLQEALKNRIMRLQQPDLHARQLRP